MEQTHRPSNDFTPKDVVQNFSESKFQEVMNVEAVVDFLKKRGKLANGMKCGTLLDVGCGNGAEARILAKYFDRVIGLDPSSSQIVKAKEFDNPDNLQFVTGSAENMPVPDGSVDVVTTFWSLHFTDVDKFVKECKRVLKSDGIAVFYSHILYTVTCVENDKLPTMADEIVKTHARCTDVAKATSHPQMHVLDYYDTLYKSIAWENKEKIEIKLKIATNLHRLLSGFLAVPFYGKLWTSSPNPMIELFKTIKKTWSMEDKDERGISVNATFAASLIILNM